MSNSPATSPAENDVPRGTSPASVGTGLFDSDGTEICFGDHVLCRVTCNVEFHGNWATYAVQRRGVVPVLMYVRSEKGRLMPEGYTGMSLAEQYDPKLFLWASELSKVRPVEDMLVVKEPVDEG